MTREELKAMGLEDEVIEKVMASHGKDIQSANAKAEKFKADAQLAGQYKKELEEIQNQNLSDIEKANKATEDANKLVSDLQNQINELNTKNALAEQGIVGDEAAKLLNSLKGGTFDAKILGEIIADRETKAAAKKEQELLDRTPNPDGAGASGGDDKSTAEKLVSKMYGGEKANTDILSNYI